MSHSSFYADNDMVVVLEGLRNRQGTVIEDASVSLTAFTTRGGAAVDGITLPIVMAHIEDGRYEASIPNVDIEPGLYKATVRAEYNGVQGEWTETLVAKRRIA